MSVRDVLYFLRSEISYCLCIVCKNGNGTEFHYLSSYNFEDYLPDYLYNYVVYEFEFNKKESLVKLFVKGEI